MPERPPRKPPPWTPEIVRVTEDERGPDTDRVPVPLPEPLALGARSHARPKLGTPGAIAKAAPNLLDEVADLKRWSRMVVENQSKMALQLDGFGVTVNSRFDVFHEELAMLRQTVTGDHAPRLEKVELSLGQKAARGGAGLAMSLVVLPMLAEAVPKYAHVINKILEALQ
jgi:hypothetical protein